MHKITQWSLGVVSIASLALYGCGGHSSGSSESGSSLDQSSKIINGSEVPRDQAPQFVPILIQGQDPTTGQEAVGLCSGTVISADQVITAAHCFEFSNISVVAVDIGGGYAFADTVHVDPRVAPRADGFLEHDVAIVHTNTPLGLPAFGVLLSKATEPGDQFGIYGYGQDENGNIGTLRGGTMTVNSVEGSLFLAKFEGQSDTCFGDSGGPAIGTVTDGSGNVVAAGLIGLTSGGTSATCAEGETSSFTNLQDTDVLDFVTGVSPGVAVF